MADCQIRCINVSSSTAKHEHITHVGNPGVWSRKFTVAEVVSLIRSKTDTFYVMDGNGHRANVGVVEVTPPHIRTYADKEWTNNLLSLTSCPI
jgi:DNA-binding helix-hairpin-helix protein with protein kinase domain